MLLSWVRDFTIRLRGDINRLMTSAGASFKRNLTMMLASRPEVCVFMLTHHAVAGTIVTSAAIAYVVLAFRGYLFVVSCLGRYHRRSVNDSSGVTRMMIVEDTPIAERRCHKAGRLCQQHGRSPYRSSHPFRRARAVLAAGQGISLHGGDYVRALSQIAGCNILAVERLYLATE